LLGALEDKEGLVRQEAARSLAEARPDTPEAVAALVRAARGARDPFTRMWAITALGRLGGRARAAIPALAHAWQAGPSGGPATPAAAAAQALEQVGVAARPALVAALGSPHARTRAAAAGLLGGMGPVPRAVLDALARLLADRDPAVRVQA